MIKKFVKAFCIFLLLAAIPLYFWTQKAYQHQLAVLAIFQDEERFLKEWIDFHRLVGVEHFYLYNNLSSDQYLKVLQPYIDRGIVELYDWPYKSREGDEADWTRVQAAAYRDGISKAQGNAKWLAMIDTDEFIFPTNGTNLVEWLTPYEDCSGILINWQVFGTSFVKRIPEGSFLIENLVLQSPENALMNTYCKSIVRPEAVKYCNDPHTVVYYPWSFAVDPDKNVRCLLENRGRFLGRQK